jgi:3-dehydroquinate dehydratase/shikimate dehydrogenase
MISSSSEHICVVIGRTRHKMMQIEIQEAGKRGARLIELRLDFLAKAPDFKRMLDRKPCPMVATVRRPQDGGRWGGTEEERRMLLRQAIVAGFDWVDLETDVADEIRRFKDVKRIISYHNLRELPADLDKIHEHMCTQDADVVKIAVRAQQPADNLRVLSLIKKSPVPTVALCMGDLGTPSRLLGVIYGAPFTYAAFNKERGIAPGILSFDDMRRIYQFDQVDSRTKIYGVIGDPVAHSLSPLIHNSAFRSLGINALYVPIRVPRGELAAFLREFNALPVEGYSVTIPHKEAAINVAQAKDPAVIWVGAANTLVHEGNGWVSYNTDYEAAQESLLANLPPPQEEAEAPTLHSKSVLLLGAGGLARAVAHALHRAGAIVTISNRTPDRALKLKEEVGCRVCDWEARNSTFCDILVNCTSVGMHPDVDDMPIHPSLLKPGMMVFDTVYTPEMTLLIKEARARGCHVLTGVDMFVRQAALQFRLFTGQEAPLELMRSVVKRALSPVRIRDEDDRLTG